MRIGPNPQSLSLIYSNKELYFDSYSDSFWSTIVVIFLVNHLCYLTLTHSEKKFLKTKRLNLNENKYLKSMKVIRDLLNIRKFLIVREKESENKIQIIEAVKFKKKKLNSH